MCGDFFSKDDVFFENNLLTSLSLLFQIDENGIHERGHWGYCNSNCSIPDEKTQIAHDINFIIKTVGNHLVFYEL